MFIALDNLSGDTKLEQQDSASLEVFPSIARLGVHESFSSYRSAAYGGPDPFTTGGQKPVTFDHNAFVGCVLQCSRFTLTTVNA